MENFLRVEADDSNLGALAAFSKALGPARFWAEGLAQLLADNGIECEVTFVNHGKDYHTFIAKVPDPEPKITVVKK